MSDWFKQFSATLTAGAIILGLVASFFAIWLPREFDTLKTGLEEVRVVSSASKVASEASEASAEKTQGMVEGLTLAFASSQAISLREDWVMMSNFKQVMPADIFDAMSKVQIATEFRHVTVGETSYIFIPEIEFNKLTSDQQSVIETVMRSKGWHLEVEGR